MLSVLMTPELILSPLMDLYACGLGTTAAQNDNTAAVATHCSLSPLKMTFVPPFFDPNEALIADDSKEARGNTDNSCDTPQAALDTCFATFNCEDGCDLFLSRIMANDCNAVLTWTCVLEQRCLNCAGEIFSLLQCFGVPNNCNFNECADAPLPPAIAGLVWNEPTPATTNNMTPEPTPAPVMTPHIETGDAATPAPSTLLDALRVNETSQEEDSSVDTPLFAKSGGNSVLGGNEWSGFIVMVAVLLLAFR